MRTLKQIRLIYRQHLLPPLVVPFEKLSQYKSIIELKKPSQSAYQSRKQALLMHQINETVITQIIKIRNSFILPIQKCPFYYQQLDNYVKAQLKAKALNDQMYLECLHSITAHQRRKIHYQTLRNYKDFKAKLEVDNPDFYKNVTLIPRFLYQSPVDLAFASKKKWIQLSDVEKAYFKEKYEEKLDNYWKTLNKIAHSSSIQTQKLVELIKMQLNPPLSSGLKKLLFPSGLTYSGGPIEN